MSLYRPLLAAAAIAMTAALATPIAALAASYSDNITGVEVFATSTQGDFVGTATGSLPGDWYATVQHSLLTTSATITGGTFDVATVLNGKSVLVTGQFNYGGSVTQIDGFSGCTDQIYQVIGPLHQVGVYGRRDTGTGNFSAVLTHYRTSVFGYCLTFAATVAGTVTLSF